MTHEDEIALLIKQVDELGSKVEASGIQWISPKADDLVKVVYAHLHETVSTLYRIAAQIQRDAKTMEEGGKG